MVMFSGTQSELPVESDALNESTLRAVHAQCRLRIPFELALRDKALSICLRNMAAALSRKKSRRRG